MSVAVAALVVDYCDADRGADDDILPVDRIRRAYRRDNSLRKRHHHFAVAGDGGNNRKLVAAETRDQIAAAQRVRKAQRDIADQFVADVMAERVVDVLEVIEIDVEHGGGRMPSRTSSITASNRSPKKMRLGRPHRGSCIAR